MTSDEIPPDHPDHPCVCGHPCKGHIYHVGSCRVGGIICACTRYRPMPKPKVKFTKVEGRP